MKKINYFIILFFLIQIIALGLIVGTAKIQDMTLATEKVTSFNSGWSRIYQSGDRENISSMPYYGNSDKEETVVFENTITKELSGKTLCFLSADKRLKIYVGEVCVYSFGYDDVKKIGHAPGSVMVFADIPADCESQAISIVAESPYENYASYMTDMVVGDRDVAILHFIKAKLPAFLCCFAILVSGILIFIFAIIQKLSKQRATEFLCMSLYVLNMFVYHIIETKLTMIFWGNQFLYSNLIFLSLMAAPIFLETYLYYVLEHYRKVVRVLLSVAGVNMVAQLILQFLNVKDFLEMAVFSHAILAVSTVVVLIMEIVDAKKNQKIDVAFVGLLVMGICGAMDLARNRWVKVGDLGKYSRIGVLVLGIAIIIDFLRKLIQRQINYVENEKAEVFSSEIINTLVAAIDAKDIYTRGHSTRVADYTVLLAKELGWSEEQIKDIRYKALLHDVGKIGIPDRVLNKADRLTDNEFEIIKSHTIKGAEILSRVSSLSNMGIVARNHHERFDGNGYPDKLCGEQIPKEARVVGICDAYDAMSSNRAYRKALPKDIIRKELLKGRGTQFDPEMTDVFLKLFDEGLFDTAHLETEEEPQAVDVSELLLELSKKQENGAIRMRIEDMGEIYQYMSGIKTRYGLDHSMVVISLVWEEEVEPEELKQAMQAMEYSILQSLRKVDVMTSISASQYLLVLTEAHEQNIQMIIDRIFTSFYSNSQNTKIKPTYQQI